MNGTGLPLDGATPARLEIGALTRWVAAVLRRADVAEPAATATAAGLVDANRRGLDSHGVVLLDMYLPRLRDGAINGTACPSIVVDVPAAVLVNGDRGLGHFVGTYALDISCERRGHAAWQWPSFATPPTSVPPRGSRIGLPSRDSWRWS